MIVAAVALTAASHSYAVCLDDNYVSGYHIPLDKEIQTARSVAIGIVISAKEVSAPYSDVDEGTVYRVKIEETLRGKRYNAVDLFSENNSGRFPMEIGHRYLMFISKDRATLYVSSCGNSGELPERAEAVGAVRENLMKWEKR